MVKLDLVVMLDSSKSIYATEFPRLKQLAINLVKEFYVHPDFVQVAVVAYADAVAKVTSLDQCKHASCVTSAMSGLVRHDIKAETHTALDTVLTETFKKGARANTPQVLIYIGSGVGTEGVLTMMGVSKFWQENIRFYSLHYYIEDNMIRMTLPKYFYIDIPLVLTPETLVSLPDTMSRRVANDLMCTYGMKYDVSTKTCKDIDECTGFPCLTGGMCINTRGSYQCKQ